MWGPHEADECLWPSVFGLWGPCEGLFGQDGLGDGGQVGRVYVGVLEEVLGRGDGRWDDGEG